MFPISFYPPAYFNPGYYPPAWEIADGYIEPIRLRLVTAKGTSTFLDTPGISQAWIVKPKVTDTVIHTPSSSSTYMVKPQIINEGLEV